MHGTIAFLFVIGFALLWRFAYVEGKKLDAREAAEKKRKEAEAKAYRVPKPPTPHRPMTRKQSEELFQAAERMGFDRKSGEWKD